jgi:hypothetical protein
MRGIWKQAKKLGGVGELEMDDLRIPIVGAK